MHVSFPPTPMWLAPGIIDDKERKVSVVLVSSYAECVPTFGVLTAEGAFYADIPPSHLHKKNWQEPCALSDLVYRNCPSSNVWGGTLAPLRQLGSARLFGKEVRTPVCEAEYLLTLDWPEDNWMSHVFLARDSLLAGRLLIWPHFRVLFGQGVSDCLPAGYRKVRQTWQLRDL